jgi:mono/diheme cytochrome c family protein
MSMRCVTLLLVMTITATVAGQIAAPPQGSAPPKGNAVNGKKVYVAYGCYQCHGYEGQGGGGTRLGPRPRLPFPAFSRYVRQPTQNMPPYTAKVVTDQELADIYAFLLTVTEPPPVSSIPQLAK